ncbi:hypothetical protein LC724_21800 [Blautia sp. RD014234]|nr:hypothetical protein [Blautia parvula]
MRRLGKRILAGIAACCMVCTTMPEIPVWADAEGTTYYVDQDGGTMMRPVPVKRRPGPPLTRSTVLHFSPATVFSFKRRCVDRAVKSQGVR